MGTALDIYRLYRWRGIGQERLVLAKATRNDFSNCDQSAEKAANSDVDTRFAKLLSSDRTDLPIGTTEFIAAWEGGFPEGDIFYGDESGVELEIWLALDAVHNKHFVFGVHADEASFWRSLEDAHALGEVCDLSHYSRPAERVRILFVQ